MTKMLWPPFQNEIVFNFFFQEYKCFFMFSYFDHNFIEKYPLGNWFFKCWSCDLACEMKSETTSVKTDTTKEIINAIAPAGNKAINGWQLAKMKKSIPDMSLP